MDLLQKSMETFQSAVKTGIRMQEESTRRFTEVLTAIGSPLDWQKKSQTIFAEAVRVAQKGVDEAIGAMNSSVKTATDLMHKALQTGDGTDQNIEQKNQRLWELTLDAMRSSTEAMLEANSRVLASWANLVKTLNGAFEQMGDGMHRTAEKAAAAAKQGD
jgi:hypothetical protein